MNRFPASKTVLGPILEWIQQTGVISPIAATEQVTGAERP